MCKKKKRGIGKLLKQVLIIKLQKLFIIATFVLRISSQNLIFGTEQYL